VAEKVPRTDVTLTEVYGVKTILILKRKNNEHESKVLLYQLDSDNGITEFKCIHILRLADIGPDIKIQIVDNLIVTHDTEYHSTKLFDIGLESEVQGVVWYHFPIAEQRALSQSQIGTKFGKNGGQLRS
jgi:hypothetical protein